MGFLFFWDALNMHHRSMKKRRVIPLSVLSDCLQARVPLTRYRWDLDYERVWRGKTRFASCSPRSWQASAVCRRLSSRSVGGAVQVERPECLERVAEEGYHDELPFRDFGCVHCSPVPIFPAAVAEEFHWWHSRGGGAGMQWHRTSIRVNKNMTKISRLGRQYPTFCPLTWQSITCGLGERPNNLHAYIYALLAVCGPWLTGLRGQLESSLLCGCVIPQLLFSIRLSLWPSESDRAR